MEAILDRSFDEPAEESILVQSATLDAKSRTFVDAVEDVVARVSSTGVSTNIRSPLALLRDGLTRLLRDNGFDVIAAVEDCDGLLRVSTSSRRTPPSSSPTATAAWATC